MLNLRVAERYSEALFQVCKKNDCIEKVEIEVECLEKIFNKNKNLKSFLESPQISSEDKESLIKKVFENKCQKVLVQFMLLLLRKNRMEYLCSSFHYFYQFVRSVKGITQARVTSAVGLNKNLKDQLVQSLEKLTKKKLEPYYIVDDKILGGLSVQIEDLLMDLSVRHHLNEMKEKLFKVKVH